MITCVSPNIYMYVYIYIYIYIVEWAFERIMSADAGAAPTAESQPGLRAS